MLVKAATDDLASTDFRPSIVTVLIAKLNMCFPSLARSQWFCITLAGIITLIKMCYEIPVNLKALWVSVFIFVQGSPSVTTCNVYFIRYGLLGSYMIPHLKILEQYVSFRSIRVHTWADTHAHTNSSVRFFISMRWIILEYDGVSHEYGMGCVLSNRNTFAVEFSINYISLFLHYVYHGPKYHTGIQQPIRGNQNQSNIGTNTETGGRIIHYNEFLWVYLASTRFGTW